MHRHVSGGSEPPTRNFFALSYKTVILYNLNQNKETNIVRLVRIIKFFFLVAYNFMAILLTASNQYSVKSCVVINGADILQSADCSIR